MKKVINTLGIILISIIIITFNLIIGANEKGLRVFPICIFMILILIYLILRKILLNQKIVIKNKVDAIVLIFMISTIFPLVFKTYSTYQGTIEFILKYFFVYAVYLLVRNTVDSKKKIDVLVTVTIFSSLIIVILGIDLQHSNYATWILQNFNLKYTTDYRFSSTFGYANSVAIYMVFCIFLAIYKIETSEKKTIKVLYIAYMLLGIYITYITYSRSVFAILVLSLILYFTIKYRKNIKKISIIGSSILVIIIIYILTIGLNYSKPYTFSKVSYTQEIKYNFVPNTEYIIQLDLDMVCKYDTENAFEINIIEVNEYFNETNLAKVKTNGRQKNYYIKFMPTEDMQLIKIKNKLTGTVTINKCLINNKEYILQYKYIPSSLGRLFKSFSIKDDSISQRVKFYEDCIKIAKNHILIGQGGNTWKKVSNSVQEYPYSVKETHSYFFELLISYGIIGVLLFILLILTTLIKFIIIAKKNIDFRKYIPIVIGLFLVISHSFLFDFDMSFLIILLIVFEYIAIIQYNNNSNMQISKYIDYIIFALLGCISCIYILANIAKYCINSGDYKTKMKLNFYNSSYQYLYINNKIKENYDYEEIINKIQMLMIKEPYYKQTELIDLYVTIIKDNIDKIEENNLIQYYNFLIDRLSNIKFVTPMYVDTIMSREKAIYSAIESIKEIDNPEINNIIKQLKNIMINEYNTNKVNIEDIKRNGKEQEDINQIKKEYNKLIREIKDE
ncbi:MAG: O-antigen ligase family protein [Clostridia bacterium]|nr:O-antigen ligase family protein [Clostridia bacterium]